MEGRVGAGTRVWAFAHVCSGAVVGENCNVGEHCYIEGGSRVGDNCTIKNGVMIWNGVNLADGVFVGPGVVFTNDSHPRSPRLFLVRSKYFTNDWIQPTYVGQGASIGANATIGSGIDIGEFAMIGGGAVVTADVPAFSLVYGNPARIRGSVCACGKKIVLRKSVAQCRDCGRRFQKTSAGVRCENL